MFSLYFDIVILGITHFGFEAGTLVLIALIPGHCLSFTLSFLGHQNVLCTQQPQVLFMRFTGVLDGV